MELLGDLLTLALLCAAVYAFTPDGIKVALKAGIGPAALALASTIRAAAPHVGRAATWLIVGKVSAVSAEPVQVPDRIHLSANLTEDESEAADAQTDAQTDRVSVVNLATDRAQFDRTRSAAIALLVACGWSVGQVRGVIKGDNGAIGAEVEAARAALGMAPPEALLMVRDGQSERLILK